MMNENEMRTEGDIGGEEGKGCPVGRRPGGGLARLASVAPLFYWETLLICAVQY